MVVKLAERAVDNVVTMLVANLGTETAAIDTDRGDGVTLAIPASGQYYKRPKSEVAGSTVHVEVFEGGVNFLNPYTDADAQRAVYEVPITVRITHFNRNVDSADTMMKRMRRYMAALTIVFLKNSDLADSDAATQVAVVEGVRPYWEIDGEDADKVLKVAAEADVLVRCEECVA